MPRANRSETVYDASLHHIVQRGVNKRGVFMDLSDYEYFRKTLLRYLDKFRGINIYHYCLIPNHPHFEISVLEAAQLSEFMKALTLAYSAYFRRRYQYTGYLWQGRYRNCLIGSDEYSLECGRYIERNPLKIKGGVKDLSKYKWSSYDFYAYGHPDPIITPDPLYESLGRTAEERQERYREYVLTERPYEALLDKAIDGV